MSINDEEKRQAKKDKAKLVANSGRGKLSAGDAIYEQLLLDYKFSEAESYSLNYNKWLKHSRDANKRQLEGVVIAVFQAHNNRSIAMVDWQYLKDLIEYKNMYEGLCK